MRHHPHPDDPNYQNASDSADCWHCSLVSYQVSYLTAENMHHFAGYILPGLVFTLLGARWAVQLIWEWNKQLLQGYYETAGLPPAPANKQGKRQDGCCGAAFSLPWEGIIKLILTGTGIIASIASAAPHGRDDEYVSSIRYATVYLFFSLSGLTDILVYYCGYSILPEGVQSFILALAFSAEALLFGMRLRFEGYLEQQIHALLVVAIVCCAIACAMEVLYDNRLVKFCRAYLCLVQGTWLVHGGCIMQGTGTGDAQTYPDSLEWVSILFTWHVAGNFVLFIVGLLLTRRWNSAAKSSSLDGGVGDCGCLQVVSEPAVAPAPQTVRQQHHAAHCHAGAGGAVSSSPAASSSSPRSSSASFHSPTTVQTNVSPAFNTVDANKNGGIHSSGLPSFSYIQAKQLPTPPPPQTAALPLVSSSLGLTVVPAPAHSSSTHFKPAAPLPSQTRYNHYPSQQQQDVEVSSSRASSRLPATVAGASAPSEDGGGPPVIVEALPRDQVVLGDDYRTLTREDELRQSIKLKESSLI